MEPTALNPSTPAFATQVPAPNQPEAEDVALRLFGQIAGTSLEEQSKVESYLLDPTGATPAEAEQLFLDESLEQLSVVTANSLFNRTPRPILESFKSAIWPNATVGYGLKYCTHLVELHVRTIKNWDALNQLSALEELTIEDWDNKSAGPLKRLGQLPSLKLLDVGNVPHVKKEDIDGLRQAPLEDLTFYNTCIQSTDLQQMTNLESLFLKECAITDDVRRLFHAPTLKELELEVCDLYASCPPMTCIPAQTALEFVYVEDLQDITSGQICENFYQWLNNLKATHPRVEIEIR